MARKMLWGTIDSSDGVYTIHGGTDEEAAEEENSAVQSPIVLTSINVPISRPIPIEGTAICICTFRVDT